MSKFRLPAAVLLLGIAPTVFGFAAQAADFIGGWATDTATCNKIFVKNGGKFSFSKDSDFYGSGLIIEENQIVGKMASCTIKSRKQEGAVTHFLLNCSTSIALEVVQFSAKIDNDNQFTRIFPGMPDLSTAYYRCPS